MIEYHSCPLCGVKDIKRVFAAEDFTVSHEHFDIWECHNCTLRFTQNIPSGEDIGRYYQSQNYISHSDTSAGLINYLYHQVRKRTLVQKKKLVQKFTQRSTGAILDVGCGTGAFLNTMEQAGWTVTGLEPDEKAARKANELYGIKPLKAMEIYNLPTGAYEAITLWHVLEHVHDLHGYMEKLKSLLKPGGKLFIAVPNYTSRDATAYGPSWAAYDVPRHLYHFSPAAMKKLFLLHGLQMDQVLPMWFDSIYVSMLSEQYKTGKSHPIKGTLTGLASNLSAVGNPEKCSSVIYVGG